MKFIVDTHAFLWFVSDDKRLSQNAKELIANRESVNYLSVASAWEMAICSSIGKLEFSSPFPTFYVENVIRSNKFTLLPIRQEHILRVESLPL